MPRKKHSNQHIIPANVATMFARKAELFYRQFLCVCWPMRYLDNKLTQASVSKINAIPP